jgi:hypothetical protein
MSKQLFNFLHFHRRRVGISLLFSSGYGYMCHRGIEFKHEIPRMAVAGSLSNLVMECTFHFADTVNI